MLASSEVRWLEIPRWGKVGDDLVDEPLATDSYNGSFGFTLTRLFLLLPRFRFVRAQNLTKPS